MAETASVVTDWSVLELEGLMDHLQTAASAMAGRYPACAADDLYQEAVIIAALNAPTVRAYMIKDEGGKLQTWLRHRIADAVARTEQARANRNTPLTPAMEERL